MTWSTFFDLHSMENRHLLASYAFVLFLQAAYFARIVWAWKHPKSPKS